MTVRISRASGARERKREERCSAIKRMSRPVSGSSKHLVLDERQEEQSYSRKGEKSMKQHVLQH